MKTLFIIVLIINIIGSFTSWNDMKWLNRICVVVMILVILSACKTSKVVHKDEFIIKKDNQDYHINTRNDSTKIKPHEASWWRCVTNEDN